jgi:hypothetical protein
MKSDGGGRWKLRRPQKAARKAGTSREQRDKIDTANDFVLKIDTEMALE